VPLIWFWDKLSDTRYGWTAAMYGSTFVIHLLVSMIEFVAFFFYINGKNRWFGWWVSTIGWWGSVVGMILPWLFAFFQLSFSKETGGLQGTDTVEFGHNAVFYIIGSFAIWVSASAMHILMSPRVICHIREWPEALPPKVLECTIDHAKYDSQE